MSQATFEDWLDKYGDVLADPPHRSVQRCPQCSQQTLQFAYVVQAEADGYGNAALWCASCLTGIVLDRSRVREGLPVVVAGSPGSYQIPKFRIVPPGSWMTEET